MRNQHSKAFSGALWLKLCYARLRNKRRALLSHSKKNLSQMAEYQPRTAEYPPWRSSFGGVSSLAELIWRSIIPGGGDMAGNHTLRSSKSSLAEFASGSIIPCGVHHHWMVQFISGISTLAELISLGYNISSLPNRGISSLTTTWSTIPGGVHRHWMVKFISGVLFLAEFIISYIPANCST